MTPEEKSLLERTYKLVQENNEMIRSMRRMARVSGLFRAAYWIVIIGLSFGAYYFIQPYLETMLGIVGGAQSNIETLQSAASKVNEIIN